MEIGTLKALGFKDRKITRLYIGYGLLISLIAVLLGIVVGAHTIGLFFMNMIVSVYEIPEYSITIPNDAYIIGAIFVLLICAITYLSCKSELKGKPADILHVKLENMGKSHINLDKGIFKKANFSVKWNLRDILRNKSRSITAIVGISCCCMLIVCGFGLYDSMNKYISIESDMIYNYNYRLVLNDDITKEKLKDITDKYGDNTLKKYTIDIKNNESKEISTLNVDDSNSLIRYIDSNNNYIKLRDDGITISKKLAEKLNKKVGDDITFHIYENDNWYTAKIVAINKVQQNQSICTTKAYIETLGIDYMPDEVYTNSDLSDVDKIDGVNIIQKKEKTVEGMESMTENMRTMMVLLIVAAAILGSVIIYNLGTLSFAEKNYQFATLKVLGFKTNKIRQIFLQQNIWITIISVIIGMPLGYLVTAYIYKYALSNDYDISTTINILSYVYSVIGTFTVSIVVNRILSKKVKNVDMVSSLKGNE